ncbi:MAG TPA: YdcF family protein [Aquabacterium sp.]|nr:YdcF family protein [Aquabacterium sp.]
MDLGAWKPVISALVMPPVPGLVLILIGARLIQPKRGWGYLILMLGVAFIWFSGCNVTAVWLQNSVLKPPMALDGTEILRLKEAGKGSGGYGKNSLAARLGIKPVSPKVAIVVLGAGRHALAREYGMSELTPSSEERLRYGIWLSRQTGVPVAFSGGVGWAQSRDEAGATEAEIAARIAQQHFGWGLHWTERQSSDTRENAVMTVAMLSQEGVSEIVLVTEAYHMPRARRAFERATRQAATVHPDGATIRITPAPMGFWGAGERGGLDWLPSTEGLAHVRQASHELLGWVVGL